MLLFRKLSFAIVSYQLREDQLQCSKPEMTCYVFASFFGVMSLSVLTILAVHWLPLISSLLFCLYCASVNMCYLIPTYLYAACGDKDLKVQYTMTASILGVSLIVFVIMFVLMWKFEFYEDGGFVKVASQTSQQQQQQQQPHDSDVEMAPASSHVISSPLPPVTRRGHSSSSDVVASRTGQGGLTRAIARPQPVPAARGGTSSQQTPLLDDYRDDTSGTISPRGFTRHIDSDL